MPCKPSDLSLTPPDFDEPSIPGFGIPTIDTGDLPNISLPDGFPEDLLDLLDSLKLALPSGLLKPNLSSGIDKTILDGVIKLLDYLTGFLAMYRFILPILNMILCIIEVLCSLANPFKLIKALRRLFRTCIPDFLALFPIFAIIIMIISLILLIIALIEYIISEILRIVNQILNNIKILARVAKRQDKSGLLAGLHKIGAILCLLKNILAVLQIVAIIIQIIKDILKLGFRIPPCDDSNQDADGCCTVDVCPQFIKNGNFRRLTGKFQYFNKVAIDSGITLPLLFGPLEASIREESWQIYDPDATLYQQFYNITAPSDVDPDLELSFFPEGKVYTETTNPKKCAYTVDMRFWYDPTVFSRVDAAGARYVLVSGAIVKEPPTQDLVEWDGDTISTPTGVVNLIGGKVYEDDFVTPVLIDGVHASINKLIHLDKQGTATISDGIQLNDVDYTFNVHHEVLFSETIITLGCIPELDVDKQIINGAYASAAAPNFEALNNRVGPGLPDIVAATECMNVAISKFRSNISVESVATFQTETLACMNDVLTSAKAVLGDLVEIGFTPNKSTFSIDPNVQFTTKPITVVATLNDVNGVNLCQKIPQEVADTISAKIIPEITFGAMTPFLYDGTSQFVSKLTSETAGTGTISIQYNDNFFTAVTVPTSLDETPSIAIQTLSFEFIGAGAAAGSAAISDGKPRRDEGDVGGDAGGSE